MGSAGVAFKYASIGPESNLHLQFNRFDFGDETLVVIGKNAIAYRRDLDSRLALRSCLARSRHSLHFRNDKD